ncbi:TPA: primosomal protein I [Enterobacter ludwigii]
MGSLIHLLDRPIAYQPAFAQLRAGKVKSGPVAAVLLSQFVYWHNRMDGDWMYKTREDIKKETGLSRDEQETARKRLVALGVLEEELRGVPATLHYRINSVRLEALLLSPGQTESQLGATLPTRRRQSRQQDGSNPPNKKVETPPTSRGESCQQAGGDPANFLTGDYTESTTENTQNIKTVPDENFSVDNSAKSELATPGDFELAKWFWSTIVELYERAAEHDGTIVRPQVPNMTIWASEIRLLRASHGCTHHQIKSMVERIQVNQVWCSQIRTPRTLRDRWAELVLKI